MPSLAQSPLPSEDSNGAQTPAPTKLSQSSRSPINIFAPCCPPDMATRAKWSSDNFVIKHRLGQGFASHVYLAVDTATRRTLALKVYSKSKLSPMYQHQVFREIEIHSKMRHEHIVQLYGAFEDAHAYNLIMEYAPGGDLYSHFKRSGSRYSEACVVCSILKPFLSALQYIHAMDVIHRDIKPENCVLSADGTIKLTDFGLSIEMAQEPATTRLGTLDYMAPEVASNPDTLYVGQHRGTKKLQYGVSVDAWAVGTLAYEMLIGRPPFWASNKAKQVQNIQCAHVLFPPWVSESSQDFIRAALLKDPTKRLGISAMLQHAWLRDVPSASLTEQSSLRLPRALQAPPPASSAGQRTEPNNSLRVVAQQAIEQVSPQPPPLTRWQGGMNAGITVGNAAATGHAFSPSPFEGTHEADDTATVCNLRNIRSALALLNDYGAGTEEPDAPKRVRISGSSPMPGSSPPQPITMIRQGLVMPKDNHAIGRVASLFIDGFNNRSAAPRLQASASATSGLNTVSPDSTGDGQSSSSNLGFAATPSYGGVIMGGVGMGSAPVKMKSLVDELLASENDSRHISTTLSSGASAYGLSEVGFPSARSRSLAGTCDTSPTLAHICQPRIRNFMCDVSEEDPAAGTSVAPTTPVGGRAPAVEAAATSGSAQLRSDPPRSLLDPGPWPAAATVFVGPGAAFATSSAGCSSSSCTLFSEALASVPEVERSMLDAEDEDEVLAGAVAPPASLVPSRTPPASNDGRPRHQLRRAATHAWGNGLVSLADSSPKRPLLKQRSALTLALSPSTGLPEGSRLASLELASDEFCAGSDAASPQGPDLLLHSSAPPPRISAEMAVPRSAVQADAGAAPASRTCLQNVSDALASACRQLNGQRVAATGVRGLGRHAVMLVPTAGRGPETIDEVSSEEPCVSAPCLPVVDTQSYCAERCEDSQVVPVSRPPSPTVSRSLHDLSADAVLHRTIGHRASTGGGVWGMAFSSIKSHVVRLARRAPVRSRRASIRAPLAPLHSPSAGELQAFRRAKSRSVDASFGQAAPLCGAIHAQDSTELSPPLLPLLHVRSTESTTGPSLLDLAMSISPECSAMDAPRCWSDVFSLLPPAQDKAAAPEPGGATPRTRAKTTISYLGNASPRGCSPTRPSTQLTPTAELAAQPTRPQPDGCSVPLDDDACTPAPAQAQTDADAAGAPPPAMPESLRLPAKPQPVAKSADADQLPLSSLKLMPGNVAKRKKKLFWSKQRKQVV